jgi:hypothetical protein
MIEDICAVERGAVVVAEESIFMRMENDNDGKMKRRKKSRKKDKTAKC